VVADEDNPDAKHAKRMKTWLAKLEQQLYSATPTKPMPDRPEAETVLTWGHQVCEDALDCATRCMKKIGTMTHEVAAKVQDALIVSLVTGCHIPPCRLNLIGSWIHPGLVDVLKCQDKDCRHVQGTCLGNHLKLVDLPTAQQSDEPIWGFDYRDTGIVSTVVHGKNEFRGTGVNLEYMMPRGTLTKLLLAHIKVGHALLTEPFGGNEALFVTSSGKEFTNQPSLLTQYWKRLMGASPLAARHGLNYFPPGAGRRIFVEGYTSRTGLEPEFWDGASIVMGSSVSRWKGSYNPSRKRRLAQVAIDQHAGWVNNLVQPGRAGVPSVDLAADDEDADPEASPRGVGGWPDQYHYDAGVGEGVEDDGDLEEDGDSSGLTDNTV
jgi:hypothetical protein